MRWLPLLVLVACDKAAFDCTRKPGGWGLFKPQADGPELIACFGGLYLPADNEKLCNVALRSVGEPFQCAAFQTR
jgi:hypothetical protein